ncbi:hypothetical protein BC829DRAFT_422221 [Chytridium lagenaria]|nr:hypothetical protein BC829DRAFT_422221 [Chytridium lagenaria]
MLTTPLNRICVVGAGPAGLYTVQKLLKIPNVHIDVLDKLPVPYGLIRYGIAPDHPEAKNVIHKFQKTLQDPRVTFIGAIDIGKHIQLHDLFDHYHRVVLSYGAALDRKLGVPGEDLKGVVGAQAIVDWYNGMFGCEACPVDLESSDTAVVVGQGNVALDVARMLISPVDLLRKTETPTPVLEALSRSRIKRVHIVGRRGPQHIAMTAKELREMLHLPQTLLSAPWPLINSSLSAFEASHASAPSTLDRSKKRVLEMLAKYGAGSPPAASREWHLDFWHTPARFEGGDMLTSAAFNVRPNGELDEKVERVIPCGVVVRSIGYQCVAIPGVPFDNARHVVLNKLGRVYKDERTPYPNLYVSGWLKRGPTGVVAATMYDAFETGECVLQDTEVQPAKTSFGGSETLLPILSKQNVRTYSITEWLKVDAYEMKKGEELGKVREKVTSIQELNRILDR